MLVSSKQLIGRANRWRKFIVYADFRNLGRKLSERSLIGSWRTCFLVSMNTMTCVSYIPPLTVTESAPYFPAFLPQLKLLSPVPGLSGKQENPSSDLVGASKWCRCLSSINSQRWR
ncbi:hypothetical protein TNCV_5090561 [Trichonephila clavipes]|nr:hypothetical protein TNCV_5090561 [Trichonephila clavipes]